MRFLEGMAGIVGGGGIATVWGAVAPPAAFPLPFGFLTGGREASVDTISTRASATAFRFLPAVERTTGGGAGVAERVRVRRREAQLSSPPEGPAAGATETGNGAGDRDPSTASPEPWATGNFVVSPLSLVAACESEPDSLSKEASRRESSSGKDGSAFVESARSLNASFSAKSITVKQSPFKPLSSLRAIC